MGFGAIAALVGLAGFAGEVAVLVLLFAGEVTQAVIFLLGIGGLAIVVEGWYDSEASRVSCVGGCVLDAGPWQRAIGGFTYRERQERKTCWGNE